MTALKEIEILHELTQKRWQNDLGRGVAAYLDEKGLEYRLQIIDKFISRLTILGISFKLYNEVIHKGLSQISDPFIAEVTLEYPNGPWSGQETVIVNMDIDWNNMLLDKFYARAEQTKNTDLLTLIKEGFRFKLVPLDKE